MNLMGLLRLLGLVTIGWTVLAVGAGVFGLSRPAARSADFFIPAPALHEVVSLDRSPRTANEAPSLFDQATGRLKPLPLPAQFRWELLSVSPWRSRDGRLEAVGRWVDWSNEDADQPFCGLGLFRLPDAAVVRRVALDVLPTSRPCWIPDRPGELLFAAGDGQLYRCRIGSLPRVAADHADPTPADYEAPAKARTDLVAWRSRLPGEAPSFMTDPVWPADRRLKHLIFVAMCCQRRFPSGMAFEPAKLWWLKMSERGDAIVAAGRLTLPCADDGGIVSTAERSPYVTIGPDGEINLCYISRSPGARGWALKLAALELDRETGLPHVSAYQVPQVLAEDLAVVSLAGTADGKSVYAFTDDGAARRFSIPAPAR